MKWGLNKADDFWNFVNVIVNEKIRKVCMGSLSPLLELLSFWQRNMEARLYYFNLCHFYYRCTLSLQK